jgi:hypothetical protein
VTKMAETQKSKVDPRVDAAKQVDLEQLTAKIVQLPPDALSYVVGVVDMATLMSNKGA